MKRNESASALWIIYINISKICFSKWIKKWARWIRRYDVVCLEETLKTVDWSVSTVKHEIKGKTHTAKLKITWDAGMAVVEKCVSMDDKRERRTKIRYIFYLSSEVYVALQIVQLSNRFDAQCVQCTYCSLWPLMCKWIMLFTLSASVSYRPVRYIYVSYMKSVHCLLFCSAFQRFILDSESDDEQKTTKKCTLETSSRRIHRESVSLALCISLYLDTFHCLVQTEILL